MKAWSEGAARAVVYQRSGGHCEVCGRAAQSYHHRNKQGRAWNPSNGLHLCGDGTRFCHGFIEANPAHAMALGLWVPRATDPATVPAYVKPNMFWRGWWHLTDEGMWSWAGDPPPNHPETAARNRAATALCMARDLTLPLPPA